MEADGGASTIASDSWESLFELAWGMSSDEHMLVVSDQGIVETT